MKYKLEASCIECSLTFCCANCRRKHEKKVHGLEYECPLCRYQKFLCKPAMISDSKFLAHVVKEHLPLHCEKCDRFFTEMDDLLNIDKCVTISELVNNGEQPRGNTDENEIDDKFELLYENSEGTNEDNQNEGENFEAIVSVDKCTRTAVITPIMRQKYLVDYDTSDSSETEDTVSSKSIKIKGTPYLKTAPKTPRCTRVATPHIRKFLLRQRVVEEEDEPLDHDHNAMGCSPKSIEIVNNEGVNKTTPSRENDDEQLLKKSNEITTPTSHLAGDRCAKIGSLVTTSTPTHPVTSTWTIFSEQGADSPLSEIEGTTGESPAQSIDNEPSKSENSESVLPKLKSIIVTNSKLRLESQDSSEKQPTFQDSGSADISANKTKRVKFAEDTVFEQNRQPSRIFRKPKRVLTPGPQKPRFCFNPRFQALIDRFESQGKTMARTPNNVVRFSSSDQGTPAMGDNPVCPVRAIDFKDDSAVAELEKSSATEKDCTGNELFKSCIDSPKENENFVQNNALSKVISALTNNIAGSLETCLSTALRSAEDHTEIQFQFVITKRKVSVKRIADCGSGVYEKTSEVDRTAEGNKENIWSAVARAVKKVFWGAQDGSDRLAPTTCIDEFRDFNESESSSKRKYSEMLDTQISPVNHKRHKFEGRIKGRPPLPRTGHRVSKLKTSFSGDNNQFLREWPKKEDTMNQSF